MNRNWLYTSGAITAVAALATQAGAAQIVYNIDYDTTDPGFASAGGSGVTSIGEDGNGNPGQGGVYTFDLTGTSGFRFASFALNFNTGAVDPATLESDNAADYTLSFDILAEGLEGASAPFSARIFTGGGNLTATPSFDVTSSYQTVSFGLDELGTSSEVANFQGSDLGNSSSVQFQSLGTDTTFGEDGDNVVRIDNIVITSAIPEPTMAMVGLAGLGMTLLRRRSA